MGIAAHIANVTIAVFPCSVRSRKINWWENVEYFAK